MDFEHLGPTAQLLRRAGRKAFRKADADEQDEAFARLLREAYGDLKHSGKLWTDEQAIATFRERVPGGDEARFLSDWKRATRPSADERYEPREQVPRALYAQDSVFVDGKFVRRGEGWRLEYQDPTTGEWSIVPKDSGPFYVKTEDAYVAEERPRAGMRWKEGVWTREGGTKGSVEYEDPTTGKWSRIPDDDVYYEGEKEEPDGEVDKWDARDFIRGREFAWPEDEDVVTERLDRQRWEQQEARNASRPESWRARRVQGFKELGH